MNNNLKNLTDIEFELLLGRMTFADDRMIDPVTGMVWPRISGGIDDGGGGDDSDDGDDAASDAAADKADRAFEAKLRRSGERTGRKKLLKELGFGNSDEIKAALGLLNTDDASDDQDAGPSKPPAQTPAPAPAPIAASVDNFAAIAQLGATVAIELAASGISKEKVKRAHKIVMSDLDPGDSPSADDVSDIIDTLRDEEPGWFAASSEDDSEKPSGIPDPGRPGARPRIDPATRGVQIYEERKSAQPGFSLPVTL